MRTALLSSLLALVLATAPAVAQNTTLNATFISGLVSALQAVNLTQTINITTSLNGTVNGTSLLANISNGLPHLIFAPTDDAWANVSTNITGNQTLLEDVFAYHILPGNFTTPPTFFPNVTLGETLLNDSAVVQLEGNKSQAVAWTVLADNNTHVLNQINDTIVVNVTSFENITIWVIDQVLTIPTILANTTVVPANNVSNVSISSFETLLQNATLSYFNLTTNTTSDVTFFDALNVGYPGFTLFAPNSSAVDASNATFEQLVTNRTAINALLFNHFINGTTLYSPLLTGTQNYTSQGGENFTFSINGTGQWVTQGNITALILQSDILLKNGVVHIIDDVFFDLNNNGTAADEALSAALSQVANQTAVPSGPIGFSLTASLSANATASGNATSSAASATSAVPVTSAASSASSVSSASTASSSASITSSPGSSASVVSSTSAASSTTS